MNRIKGPNNARYIHGLRDHPFRNVWKCMRQRCDNSHNDRYKDYGGRGIKCEWTSFLEFRDDMFESYLTHVTIHGRHNTSLDRIDNDKSYSKHNCRWATRLEQHANRRNNHFVEYRGQSKTISQWARERGMLYQTLETRLRRGWSPDRALAA